MQYCLTGMSETLDSPNSAPFISQTAPKNILRSAKISQAQYNGTAHI